MGKTTRFLGRLIGWSIEAHQAAGEVERIEQVLEDGREQIRKIQSEPVSVERDQRLGNVVYRTFLEVETSVGRLKRLLRNKD